MNDVTQMNGPGQLQRYYEAEIRRINSDLHRNRARIKSELDRFERELMSLLESDYHTARGEGAIDVLRDVVSALRAIVMTEDAP